jgi:autotransporter-associated beta strand protein
VLTPFEQLTVGSNNLSTRFSGIIDDQGFGGSLAKVGTGKLVLSGANNYSNGTTISGGALLVGNRRGSATGSGAVQVLSGILGGAGSIAGPVTIGTGSGEGAFLAPSKGSGPKTLRILSPITLQSDATYNYKMNTRQAIGDRVIANGVTIESSAQISITFVGHRVMTVGTVFTLFSNTAVTPISGIFANLADGSTLTIGSNTLQASYSGGDGNDLTLTVVP